MRGGMVRGIRHRELEAQECPAYNVEIFIAGDLGDIRRICRDFCLDGACVSITPCDFAFTGGLESGARLGFINYPRFPMPPEQIELYAENLAKKLVLGCAQGSCSIVTPERTIFLNRRGFA